jgi:hypothetical protein
MPNRKTVPAKYKGVPFGVVEIEQFGPNLSWHIKATVAYDLFFRFIITPTLREMELLPLDKEAVVHKVNDDCVEYGDRQIIL